MFKNQLDFNFEGVSMKLKDFSEREKVDNKMVRLIEKNKFRYSRKIENDINVIKQLITELDSAEKIKLISKAFDSPNIINALAPEIIEIYISTWAITPAGIAALVNLVELKKIESAYLLLDKTHSYKWIFTSGAYAILKGKIKIKFAGNHSKFVCIKTKSNYYTFIGSMNLSNNPRYENIEISKSFDDFKFYSDFIKNMKGVKYE